MIEPPARPSRRIWTDLTPEQLLAQCEVDTYRASGPGGQKRNKTSSAVRLRHRASGLMVIAEESRSQHENKARALTRLRKGLFLQWRDPLSASAADHPDFHTATHPSGALHLTAKDPRFWPTVGVVLDVLSGTGARVADAAELLGVTTGNLIDFLQTDSSVWQEANRLRAAHGQKPLR